MRPLAFFVCGLVAVSFYFQNVVGPIAQTKLYTLIISMKQKSPEVDIPEGMFYSDIEGYNIRNWISRRGCFIQKYRIIT